MVLSSLTPWFREQGLWILQFRRTAQDGFIIWKIEGHKIMVSITEPNIGVWISRQILHLLTWPKVLTYWLISSIFPNFTFMKREHFFSSRANWLATIWFSIVNGASQSCLSPTPPNNYNSFEGWPLKPFFTPNTYNFWFFSSRQD